MTKFILFFLLLSGIQICAETVEVADAVRADAVPGALFYSGEKPVLRFAGTLPDSRLEYQISDWLGRPVGRGEWFPTAARRQLVLAPLPGGFYHFTLRGGGTTWRGSCDFAVLEQNLSPAKDSFCALNSSLIWCSYPKNRTGNDRMPESGWESLAAISGRGGFTSAREFVGWKEMWPEPEKFRWEKYDLNIGRLHQAGTDVLLVYRDSVRWARYRDGRDDGSVAPAHFPDDLLLTFEFSRMLASRYRDRSIGLEFWNEPDGGFAGAQSAWDFASAMKAASLGFRAGAPEVPVLNGAFCTFPVSPYIAAALENDLLEYIDIFNYHTYQPLSDYPVLMEQIQRLLAPYGAANMPIWFTEVGTRSEGSGRIPSLRAGRMEHDGDQELLVAEFYPKSLITLLALGVSRTFPFALVPHNELEGTKVWGLVRQDHTVKPAFVALAVLHRLLGKTACLGELQAPEGCRAFLFEAADGIQTVVFWRKSELDLEKSNSSGVTTADRSRISWELPLPDGEYQRIDLLGRRSVVKAQNGMVRLACDRFPAYLSGRMKLNPAIPARKNDRRPPRRELNREVISKIVLTDDMRISTSKTSVEFRSEQHASFLLELFNLSRIVQRGTVRVCGVDVEGIPAEMELPPLNRKRLKLKMKIPVDSAGTIRVEGRFNDREISRLAMNYRKFDNSSYTIPLDRFNMADAWKTNGMKGAKMDIRQDKTENAVRFDVDFRAVRKGETRWVAPIFPLQYPQEAMDGVVGVEFELKINGDPAETRWPFLFLAGPEYKKREYISAVSGSWRKHRILFENVRNPELVRELHVALSGTGDRLSFSIRNFKFYYSGRPD